MRETLTTVAATATGLFVTSALNNAIRKRAELQTDLARENAIRNDAREASIRSEALNPVYSQGAALHHAELTHQGLGDLAEQRAQHNQADEQAA